MLTSRVDASGAAPALVQGAAATLAIPRARNRHENERAHIDRRSERVALNVLQASSSTSTVAPSCPSYNKPAASPRHPVPEEKRPVRTPPPNAQSLTPIAVIPVDAVVREGDSLVQPD